MTVTLQSSAGVVAALTLTDVTGTDGAYGFANVPAGNYTLSFAVPVGYAAVENAGITVVAGQTATVPDRMAVKEELGAPGVYIPVIQR